MTMPQPTLDLNETLIDALRDVVKALGGAKRVAPGLRPEKTVDEAARWLLDCLNPDRSEHLYPEQVLWLLCEGRHAGVHAGMAFLCRAAGYAEPVPLEPQDELAALQRAYIDSVAQQRAIADRLERLLRAPMQAVK